jgi:hypothetical protein
MIHERMAPPAAAQIITIGRSEHPEWKPEEVLSWHIEHRDWWSSTQHDGRIWKGMLVFVRFVPGSEVIGRARILNPNPTHHDEGPEPDLHWQWNPVEYLDHQPIPGVFLSDFGIDGGRARPGLIGVSTPEREEINAQLEAALNT